MPFLFKKKSRGKIYYYIGENKRVDGKVVRAWEIYVGTAEKILQILQNPDPVVKEVEVLKFGKVAAVYAMLRRLQVRELVNQTISTKRNQGLDLGLFVELMIINRCVDPKSKSKHDEWYKETFLKLYQPISSKDLHSKRFWDHMNYFKKDHINTLEKKFVSKIIPEFDLKLDCLLYDPTNFSTYCRAHKGQELAKRGNSKSKRFDLLQVNLTLLTTREDGIPLLHDTYAGNINDVSEFKEILPKITNMYETFNQYNNSDLTLIFDKGNNSEKGLELVNSSGYHFVGSLKPSTHKKLLAIPKNEYNDTWMDNNGEEDIAYRINKKVYKIDCTLILTYSEASANAAEKVLTTSLSEADLKLKELSAKIGEPYYRKKSSIETKIKKIISKKSIKGLLKVDLTISNDDELKLVWNENDSKIASKRQSFGKRILFTDQIDWSTEDIIKAYQSQWRVERDFHELKSPDLIRVTPMYHWTDQKIRVHLFICVMALSIQRLLHREIKKDLPQLSIDNMWSHLDKIYQVGFFMSPSKKVQYKLTKLSKIQEKMVERFDLTKYTQ